MGGDLGENPCFTVLCVEEDGASNGLARVDLRWPTERKLGNGEMGFFER